MAIFLYTATALGAVIGLLHGVWVYRQVKRDARTVPNPSLRASYFAVWTLVLWTLFGAYILVFWLVGVVTMRLVARRPARIPA